MSNNAFESRRVYHADATLGESVDKGLSNRKNHPLAGSLSVRTMRVSILNS